MPGPNQCMRFLAVLFLLWGSARNAAATHIVGGDMTYEYLGGDDYRVFLYLYVDCFKGSIDAIEGDKFSKIGVFNHLGALVNSLSLTRSGPVRIEGKNYSCVIPPSDQCVDLYIYEAFVTLTPSVNGYSLVFQRCCRNHSIANITNPGGTGATFRTFIPSSTKAATNSSAKFTGVPPNFLCKSEPLVYDHSAVDPDGDSLVYELVAPLNGGTTVMPAPDPSNFTAQTPIVWKSPYNAGNQIGSDPLMAIDPQTGEFTVTPNVTGQYVVGIAVHEFRNGKKINTVFRDFQFNIYDCHFTVKSVFAPKVGYCDEEVGFTNSSIGSPVRFSWDFGVPDRDDDTSNAGSPDFVYPGPGKYTVKMSAYSNAGCGHTSTRIVHILPDVVPGVLEDSTVCYDGKVMLSSASPEADITYSWTPPDGLDDAFIPAPTATVTIDRTYTVRRSSVSCFVEEDVDVIVDKIDADFVHEYLPPCDGLRVKYFAKGNNYTKLSWDFGDPNSTFDRSVNEDANWFYADSGIVYATLRVENKFCRDSVTKPLKIYFPEVFTAVIDKSICLGDTLTIGPLNDTSILDFTWSSPLYLSSDQVLYPVVKAPVTTWYVLTKTYAHCKTRDSFNIIVNELPDLSITSSDTGKLCLGDNTFLKASGDYDFEWFPKEGLSNPFESGTWATPGQTTRYYLAATTDKGCVDSANILIETYPMWELNLEPHYVKCLGEVFLPDPEIPDANIQWVEMGSDVIIDSMRKEGIYVINVVTQCQNLLDTTRFLNYNESYCAIDLPNSFTPNGDGLNDTYPYGGHYTNFFGTECSFEEYSLIIFNRWGEIVFRTNDPTAEWDGVFKDDNGTIDVYGYYLSYREFDWCKGKSVVRVKRGNLTALH